MLKFVDIPASGHAFGLALGQFGKAAVHELLLPSPLWHTLQAWQGSEPLQAMQQLTQSHFPWIWEEIEGLALGLDIHIEDAFLWNCRGDLWAMAPDGCTTVQLPGGPDQPARLTHNEDGLPFFKPHCGIVRAQGHNGMAFTSFAYPGSLPGHTFAVNAQGLGITVNNIRTRLVTAGVPRMVLCRAALELGQAQDVVALLQAHPRAGGFHLSVAQAGSPDIYSVEFTTHRVSAEVVQAPSLHANHLAHASMRHHPQLITNSSGFRQERGDEILAADRHALRSPDPLRILADQHNALFPIYRDAPNDSDDENTMATADMVIGPTAIDWTVYAASPLAQPSMRFRNAHPVAM